MTELRERFVAPRLARLDRPERVDDLIQVHREPFPWAARMLDDERIFRGRLHPGPVLLPARRTPPGRMGTTFGLATRPVMMRTSGHTFHVPANIPWVIRTETTWRLGLAQPTDLRIVHCHRLDPFLLSGAVSPQCPTLFDNREAKIVRAAIRTATPVWVDATANPLKDLAVEPCPTWHLINTQTLAGAVDRDLLNAFCLMVTWAFERNRRQEDPRKLAVVQYVRTNMFSPEMSTQSIAEHLRMSRRSLQSLFETEGGLARYIRRQRLMAVIRLLTENPRAVPDYERVARLTGLGSRRTLERAMRQAYGLTPRQARSHVLAGHRLTELPHPRGEDL